MLTAEDVAYITGNFVPLDDLCVARGRRADEVRGLIAAGRLPRPSYTLDDGTEMVPEDYFALAEDVGVDNLEASFRERYAVAAQEIGVEASDELLASEWEGYLSGDYGVCLRRLTPENVCAKGFHMQAIQALLDAPRPDDPDWLRGLADHVGALDSLERPFAPYDRVRWGPVSRDRLITPARERYPQAFSDGADRALIA